MRSRKKAKPYYEMPRTTPHTKTPTVFERATYGIGHYVDQRGLDGATPSEIQLTLALNKLPHNVDALTLERAGLVRAGFHRRGQEVWAVRGADLTLMHVFAGIAPVEPPLADGDGIDRSPEAETN
ncbi:hypothetical protein [Roseisolibacter sp. H3M3-2]|uniref:hypothetical protein n=1 Tax=Roseisolibacter sp. H3M3-2 TaxID=3031323 RepID=UPI0023DC7C76|nr:hypothetical protein [Roseisolibacter sp. H3M3-2]MDF1502294.1 hypothetical protein [Roseisolibacter sp. H3M3-2]